ncbi:MAG TPA: hypothetical protein VLF15_01215, partial [Pseudoxanthomonas sp.]|nr:hypothetical protein [Pseudoxanthomonas sp.]
AIDRDDEVFDASLLADFARTLPGKGLFIKHPSGWDGDSGPGKGRWFEAEVQRMSLDEARTLLRAPGLQWPPGVTTAEILMAGAYLVRTDSNKDLLTEIDAGIVSDVSIGFNAKRGGNIVDEAGRELTARRLTSPGEALEGSLVWLGAQPGARAIKGAQRTEDYTVDIKELYDAAKANNDALKANNDALKTANTDLQKQVDASKPSHDIVLKAREALGDHAHLLEKPELLGEACKAAETYRGALISDIVAGERHAGLCGDDDEAVKAASAVYAGFGLVKLEQLAKHYRERTPTGSKVTPSNPNAPAPSKEDGTKGAPAAFAAATLL